MQYHATPVDDNKTSFTLCVVPFHINQYLKNEAKQASYKMYR